MDNNSYMELEHQMSHKKTHIYPIKSTSLTIVMQWSNLDGELQIVFTYILHCLSVYPLFLNVSFCLSVL